MRFIMENRPVLTEVDMNYWENIIQNTYTFLMENGYKVNIKRNYGDPVNEGYHFVTVSGKGIVGAFCTPNTRSYSNLSGKFAAIKEEDFTTYGECTFVVSLPITDRAEFLEKLEELGK